MGDCAFRGGDQVTDHRQPPPIAGPDGHGPSVAPAAKAPLALPMPHLAVARRLGINRRRVSAAIAIILAGIVLGATGYQAVQYARRGLAAQPAYQFPFRAIALEPPPPDWYRGGTPHFLDDVRRQAKMPETVPILELKRDELKQAFLHSPWTEEVLQVVYPPLGVAVHLAFRRPVAFIETSSGEKYLVDGSAVILPQEDLDTDVEAFVKEHRLIRIKGRRLTPPLDTRPGTTWKPRAGATDLAEGNDRIPSAVKLAGFLVEKMRTLDKDGRPALDIRYINPMDDKGRGLFMWNAESTIILWGDAPGEERPESLKAEEKWQRLREWSRRKEPTAPSGADLYWQITPSGVVSTNFTKDPSPESAQVGRSSKDASAIRTAGPGQ